MTRQELADHISKQMEESAQMGEPPSFAFENVTDAAQLLRILRSGCAGPNESALSLMEKHKLFAIYQVGNSCWYVSGWKDDQKIEGYGDTLEAAVLKCAAFYATSQSVPE